MKQPHDNWATYYDFVYERTFGNSYITLTTDTINVIREIMSEGTIIDYGAGTGRLTIPLKQLGYNIIAVEKSVGMINVLKSKADELNINIPAHNCSISEFENGNSGLALCLFTVLSYTTTENEIRAIIQTIYKHLERGGYLFFDLPNFVFFNSGRLINIKKNDFNRVVTLASKNNDDVYTYKENCSGIFKGQKFGYADEFSIRYWELNFIDKLLQETGLFPMKKNFSLFNITGSTYNLYQKQ